MRKSLLLFAVALMGVVVTSVGTCVGQQTTGTVTGRVTDQSAGVVPGAEVELKNAATNKSAKSLTSDEGNYVFRQLTELPLSSRNALEIAEMAPGVMVDSGSLTGGSQVLGRDGVAANVNGARRQQNSFYLDGTDNSGAYRNLGLQMPNPEAVEEVQITTSTNSAEFGKQPGGYFNVITKSCHSLFLPMHKS